MDPADLVADPANTDTVMESTDDNSGEGGDDTTPLAETQEFKDAVDARLVDEKRAYEPFKAAWGDPRYQDAIASMLRGEDIAQAGPPAPAAPTPQGPNPYDAIGADLATALGAGESQSLQKTFEPLMRQIVSVSQEGAKREVDAMRKEMEEKLGAVSGSLAGLKSIANLDSLLRSDAEVLDGVKGHEVAHLRDRFVTRAESLHSSMKWEEVIALDLAKDLVKNGINTIRQRNATGRLMDGGVHPGNNPTAPTTTRTPYRKGQGARSFNEIWSHQSKGLTDAELAGYGN